MRGHHCPSVPTLQLIITVFQQCQKANVAVKLFANAKQGEELKWFQKTSQITMAQSIEEARAAM